MAQKLLGGNAESWGTFPAKTEQNKNEPILNIQDFPNGTKIVIHGAIKYVTDYGDSIMLYVEVEGKTGRAKMYTTKTVSDKLIPVIAKMEFPYPAKIFKGVSEKYKKEFTSIEDIE